MVVYGWLASWDVLQLCLCVDFFLVFYNCVCVLKYFVVKSNVCSDISCAQHGGVWLVGQLGCVTSVFVCCWKQRVALFVQCSNVCGNVWQCVAMFVAV